MNTNYNKGVRKERKIVNAARAKNYISFRSAGSHSPIDVVVINPQAKTIQLIQCKPSDMPENARRRLTEQYSNLNGAFDCSFHVI